MKNTAPWFVAGVVGVGAIIAVVMQRRRTKMAEGALVESWLRLPEDQVAAALEQLSADQRRMIEALTAQAIAAA